MFGSKPALASDAHPIGHIAQSLWAMRVWIDASEKPLGMPGSEMTPIQVEAVRIGV